MWRWWNFLEARAHEKHARIVKINLDETSLALRGKSLRGHVFANRAGLGERVSKQELRARFTHVALVSDQIDVQRKLPQYIVGNEALFPARRMHGCGRARLAMCACGARLRK